MKKQFTHPIFLSVALLVILLFGIAGYYFELGYPAWLTMVVGILLGAITVFLLQLLAIFLWPWFKRIPVKVVISLIVGFVALLLLRTVAFGWPSVLFYALASFGFICCLFLLFGIWKMAKENKRKQGLLFLVVALVLAVLGYVGFSSLDGDPYTKDGEVSNSSNITTLAALGVEDPTVEGAFKVDTFTYGSGTDKKRPEYASGVKIKTPTVDASLLLPDWKGKKKKWREKFWGFGVTNFPLNGRVYMPQGKGPFPLVLIVHGNHNMIDYSDDGYGYLGTLLASRGNIVVSVDENFINAHWSGDFRGKEMPTRGWLLLKHLEQWKHWNAGEEASLKGKVDMENIVLIGHSRGGEAVSIAAAFNQLDRFPDNANEIFDFNFGIKGIVTIAPTDYRYDRQMHLKNINYLSLQGSYDSDETSFWGMRPYHRLTFSKDFKGFKAGLYIDHANHGQFNSTWGRADFGPPMSWLLNLEPLMTGEEQRKVAQVYISAFVDRVFKGKEVYKPMFQNAEMVADWLPEETYLSQYEDNAKSILLDFEEDIDVSTGSSGIQVMAENLKVWRETELSARDGGSQENNAVVLGWAYDQKHKLDSLPTYTIALPDSLKNWAYSDSLVFSMAMGDPKELKLKKKESKETKDVDTRFDFSMVVKDSLGNTSSVAISETNELAEPIRSKFTKFKFLDKQMMGKNEEVQLKNYYIPMSRFKSNVDSLNLSKIQQLELVFDKDSIGVIILDDLGLNRR
ncbi:hypothetical protein [Flagellimonas beolgyonensis]|uniref:hypothetical protein n=1 Tax=Flagellimonas beolgyonensis TaxID=864064 RepID=UPI003D65C866